MADNTSKEVKFKKVENGYIVTQRTTTFDSNGNWKNDEVKEFVSTSASGTKKLINELTDDLTKEVKDVKPSLL